MNRDIGIYKLEMHSGLYYCLLIILLLITLSCKTPQQEIEGRWEIVKYEKNEIDILSVLNKYYLKGNCQFTFSDPESGIGTFGTHHEINDSIIWSNFAIDYDKPDLIVNGLMLYSISYRNNLVYNSFSDTTKYINKIPTWVFEGKWKVKKQGEKSLELERPNDSNVYFTLRRL